MPAPRGDVSGNTRAIPSASASLKKPAFHGLVSHRMSASFHRIDLGMGLPGIFIARQAGKVVKNRGLGIIGCRRWQKHVELCFQSPERGRLRFEYEYNLSYMMSGSTCLVLVQRERSAECFIAAGLGDRHGWKRSGPPLEACHDSWCRDCSARPQQRSMTRRATCARCHLSAESLCGGMCTTKQAPQRVPGAKCHFGDPFEKLA